jgi:hypothetical protein
VFLQHPSNRGPAHSMPKVLQGALNPRVAPGRVLRRHAHDQHRMCAYRRGRPPRRRAYVEGRATNSRYHRRTVSGETIVATSASLPRPSRCPRAARRRRSGSLSRNGRLRSCAFKTRFSSAGTRSRRPAPAAPSGRAPQRCTGTESRANSTPATLDRVLGHYGHTGLESRRLGCSRFRAGIALAAKSRLL